MTAAGTVRIRAPRPDDASRLAELSTQLGYPATAGDIGGRLSRLLPRTEHLLRVAESPEGDVIGWIHAEERQILESGPWCEIMGLVVDAAHRGHGAGRGVGGGRRSLGSRTGAPHGQGSEQRGQGGVPSVLSAIGLHPLENPARLPQGDAAPAPKTQRPAECRGTHRDEGSWQI